MGIAYILGIILNCFYVNGLAIAYAFVQALAYPKPPSHRTCLMKKACTFQTQQKKRKSALERSGSGDTER